VRQARLLGGGGGIKEAGWLPTKAARASFMALSEIPQNDLPLWAPMHPLLNPCSEFVDTIRAAIPASKIQKIIHLKNKGTY